MKFVLIQNTWGGASEPAWYRKVTDLKELDDHQTGYAQQYFIRTWEDPHFEAALQKGCARAVALHPMNIVPKRGMAMIKALLREGVVYINRVGGWMVPSPHNVELEEIEADAFPEKKLDKFNMVYIHKWPLGNHYYLVGWPNPLPFKQEKFNTPEEARLEAEKHVSADKVCFKDPPCEKFVYSKQGD